MDRFLSRYGDSVIAVLSGFDRLVFRGSLRRIAHTTGLATFLSLQKILLKDFKNYALDLTATIKNASIEQAEKQGRPVVYLESAARNKEAIAREIASREGIEHGLIVVLSCIEPCLSFEIRRNRQAKQLELNHCLRKCLHLYHYFLDPVFGFMSARIQTWLPFNVQVCINGCEWLALQMDHAGIHYRRKGNCFTWVEDADKAQREQRHKEYFTAEAQSSRRAFGIKDPWRRMNADKRESGNQGPFKAEGRTVHAPERIIVAWDSPPSINQSAARLVFPV